MSVRSESLFKRVTKLAPGDGDIASRFCERVGGSFVHQERKKKKAEIKIYGYFTCQVNPPKPFVLQNQIKYFGS